MHNHLKTSSARADATALRIAQHAIRIMSTAPDTPPAQAIHAAITHRYPSGKADADVFVRLRALLRIAGIAAPI